jgi:hypothetical protein
VVDVVFPGGSAFRTRITQLDVGADFSLALKGESETAATYVSTVLADGGSGRPPQVIGANAATRLVCTTCRSCAMSTTPAVPARGSTT